MKGSGKVRTEVGCKTEPKMFMCSVYTKVIPLCQL